MALENYADSELFTVAEKVALEYADGITLSDRDISDAQFTTLREEYDGNSIVALTAVIAWENASAKFNRALRVDSQGLWKRSGMEQA